MEKQPFFSIGIPVYNAEKYLSLSFGSVFNQPFDDWELLVVDDGSRDNSLAIVNEYEAALRSKPGWRDATDGYVDLLVRKNDITAASSGFGLYFCRLCCSTADECFAAFGKVCGGPAQAAIVVIAH